MIIYIRSYKNYTVVAESDVINARSFAFNSLIIFGNY